MVLSTSFDTVDDLKDLGIPALHAKTLFKLIVEWKSKGLPAKFLLEIDSPGIADVRIFRFETSVLCDCYPAF